MNPRIHRGLASERNQFPYYVFLEKEMASGIMKTCGASLISADWVVTAAHCIEGVSSATLHFGLHETRNRLETGRIIQSIEKNSFFSHPGYAPFEKAHDIALIRLNQSIQFSELIQSIKIAESFNVDDQEDLIAIGNGIQGNGGSIAEKLEWIQMVPISAIECRNIYPIISTRKSIFCARNEDGGSISFGDSGGPIIRKSDNKLIGISSFVHGSGTDKGIPQAFTDITTYTKWIRSVTNGDDDTNLDSNWFLRWFEAME